MSLQAVPVHVEVCLLDSSPAEDEQIREAINSLLLGAGPIYRNGAVDFRGSPLLVRCCESIDVVDLPSPVSFWRGELRVHIIRLCSEGPEAGLLEGAEGEAVNACDELLLPSRQLHGLWGTLVLEEGIKDELLEYAATAMLFADRGVSPTVVSGNRVVLLHGPPGTGKTTLCKALAHKLSIRLGHRYSNGALVEVNAHALFSKFFSESGKLVARLFKHVQELADDDDCLVCLLIDEVESLTAARSAAVSGSEPSDAVRVVNAVLTQLDRLRARSNVLILATTNMSNGCIDLAFVDRADIKQYVGLPPCRARYAILASCVQELARAGIVTGDAIPAFDAIASPASSRCGAKCSGGTAAGGSNGCISGSNNQHERCQSSSANEKTTSLAAGCSAGAGQGHAVGDVDLNAAGSKSAAALNGSASDPMVPCTPQREPWTASSAASSGSATSCESAGPGSRSSLSSPDVCGPLTLRAAALGRAMLEVAEACEGLSGRALRKLPLLAHAFFVRKAAATAVEFVRALAKAAEREQACRRELGQDKA